MAFSFSIFLRQGLIMWPYLELSWNFLYNPEDTGIYPLLPPEFWDLRHTWPCLDELLVLENDLCTILPGATSTMSRRVCIC